MKIMWYDTLSPVIQSISPIQQSSPQSSPVIRYNWCCCCFLTGTVPFPALHFWILNWRGQCRCVLLLLFDWKRMSLSTLRPLKDPQHISAVKAESEPWWRAFRSCWLETKMLLMLTWNQDAAGTRPWCRWAASLLPSRFRKLAIMKQWFELTIECSASEFSWHWWQRLTEYKLVLVLSLDQPPGKWNCRRHPSCRVVASCGKR